MPRRTLLLALILALPLGAAASDLLDDIAQYVPYAGVFALKATGVESRDDWARLSATSAASWAVAAAPTYVLKHTVREWRPDHTDRRSFPSGHSAIAFAGATALCREYGHTSPWIPIAGYAVATATAADRVLRDRHHWYDVAAGAAIGVGAAELTFFLSNRLFPARRPASTARRPDAPALALTFSGTRLDIVYRW